MCRARRVDRGAAAVEFALIAMILMAMLVGILEFGRLWAVQASLAQASREAAREMAIKDDAAGARSHFYSTFTPLGDNAAQASTATVTITRVGTRGSAACRDVVTSIYETAALTGFFGTAFTVDGKSSMRCGG